MKIDFPYPNVELDIPDANIGGVYSLPGLDPRASEEDILLDALATPIGSPRLRDTAHGKRSVLVVCDDVSRPTPAWKIIPPVLHELQEAGVPEESVELMVALGSHRPMTSAELSAKVGTDVYARFAVHNHEWDNPDALEYVGNTDQGAEVWINKRVARAELVIGVGRIMPLEVCGFTGGGKILIPGCCGEVTNSEIHWRRVDMRGVDIIGRRDNPVRASIDAHARKAGLGFIVNVVMDARGRIVDCVAGDLVEAHREGAQRARLVHEVRIPGLADIVVVDGYPFDIEFWQVNKALDTAGQVVRPGGVVICVSPCREGYSVTHEASLLEFGYRSTAEVRRLVERGLISHKVVAVHMTQVREVMDRARVYLVTDGICAEDVARTGLSWAPDPQDALSRAFAELGSDASVVVLRHAAEMLPVVGSH